MRKGLISVLMIPLLFLAACGDQEAKAERDFAAFRASLANAERITLRAALTADYGGTVQDYVLSAVYDGAETRVTVEEPELIAGVTAAVKRGETSISYDGVLLGAGPLDAEGTTPVSAIPVILMAMTDGYVELLWREGSYLTARLYAGESSACTVWLDEETRTPVSAEISNDGKTVIACRFTAWELAPGEPSD